MSSEKTINSVNDFALSYDCYIQHCQWVGTDILFGLMFDHLIPGQKILDLGIGTGLSSLLFKQFGLIVYGIDGSDEMIKICREKEIAAELKMIDLSKNISWFEDRTFDHIISHGVFHLVGDLMFIASQASLLLNKGGCFAFTYLGISEDVNYKESDVPGLFEWVNLQSGIKVYRHSDDYINQLMEQNGFNIIKKTEFLAFVDAHTNARTFFNVVVAEKFE